MSAAPQFTPEFGRKSRRFDRMWQCVQYATGYDAQTLGVALLPAYTCSWYELGRQDAIEDAKDMTFLEYLKKRRAEIEAANRAAAEAQQ